MNINSLSLVNYRNFEDLELEFISKINCFIGNNGVGKTNILDSIYYLSFCKSWLNPIDSQNINYEHDFFLIKGNYMFDEKTTSISCGLKKGKKKSFKRNNKEYTKLSDHIGLIPLVTISPYDTNLLLGGSEERRKFLDIVISQFDKDYLQDLLKYNRVLSQRNHLLKQFAQNHSFDSDSLEIWDDQLVLYGTNIFNKRQEFIDKLIPIFQKYYQFISPEKEKIDLKYRSQLTGSDFAEILKQNTERDKILQYTTTGIHKDDLIFQLKGFPLKKNASQGQQKSYLIAIKLAQFDYIKNISKIKPILLFDDIFDKLDALRVEQIVKLVAGDHFGQIFITDTNKERLERILNKIAINYKLFRINDELLVSEKKFD
ncbi:MAG: DNA replication and repair protein RecF [Bacteroidetes bacterium 4572_117]|nr:MAG: DNA replication and repair protein RecF [Bacteroidetes bacterium 4572_117]